MRLAILLDNLVTDKEYFAWVEEDRSFWKEFVGIDPTYTLIRTDYTTYPYYFDSDGDVRPTQEYLKSLNDQAVAKLGEFGFDFTMVMVHEDNWQSAGPKFDSIQRTRTTPKKKGIWGTNYSYVFGKQCLEYCRWDRDNSANTFGTAYHERHHSFYAIIKQELSIDIQPILGVKKYDYEITHGNNSNWEYIRHKENTDSLDIMKPYLLKSFSNREQHHQKNIIQTLFIIKLLKQVVYLLRMQLNKKNGVPNGG